MTYVRLKDKRLCVPSESTDAGSIGLHEIKYESTRARKSPAKSRLTYKIKNESVITESRPSPPRPVFASLWEVRTATRTEDGFTNPGTGFGKQA